MSKKSGKIAALIDAWHGSELAAQYLGYFECFNRGQFFEAHDVLEELWLKDRRGPDGAFYQGLIQFTGAFVHLGKCRMGPAAALLKLARSKLQKYPPVHRRLDVQEMLGLIEKWLKRIESGELEVSPFGPDQAPKLSLMTH